MRYPDAMSIRPRYCPSRMAIPAGTKKPALSGMVEGLGGVVFVGASSGFGDGWVAGAAVWAGGSG